MNLSTNHIFARKFFFRCSLVVLFFIQLIAYQNCTQKVHVSSTDVASKTSELTLGQNGSGYEGKLYAHQNRCAGEALNVESAIKDFGNQGGTWLVRENCADLKAWKQIQDSELARSSHDKTILGYSRKAYDLVAAHSEQVKTTAAFCVASSANQRTEAQVWLPTGQTHLVASVFENSTNLTGNLSLLTPTVLSSSSTLYQSQPQYLISIEAYGEAAENIWPLMRLAVDGQEIAQSSVNSPTASLYSFTTQLKPGPHNLQIKFMNDFYAQKPEDRNLILRSISIKAIDDPGTATALDLTKMTAVPPGLASSFYILNDDLRMISEIEVQQSVQFPAVSYEPSISLMAADGTQSSQLQYIPAATTSPIAVPVTCFLQPVP